ncbi:MAG: hypothetical protein NTV80_07560, partial [Verrucomicrobia bacterium]|nr:hypothetical protein [Verrucomicrobiota bacterium]
MYLKKPIVICCLCFLGFAKLAYSSEVLSTPPPSEEIPELTDQEVRDAAEEELERLKQKLEYLDELIDDAEGYGEEPY